MESQRYPGSHFDAYETDGTYGKLRLTKADPTNIIEDNWGLFTAVPVKPDQNIVALESNRYPGYFFDALYYNGNYGSIRLVKATTSEMMSIGGDPWGWFKM
jgi:hypothetical protein